MKILFLCLLLVACGKPDNDPNPTVTREAVTKKQVKYRGFAPQARDHHGAVLTDECDSAHFSALEGAVTEGVDLHSFFDADDGKMHRLPTDYPECFPERSGSESAKEMYSYLALNALMKNDLPLVLDSYHYGRKHEWIMGDGALSRVFLTPPTRAIMAQAIEALGGPKYPDRLLTPPRPKGLRGFEAFIQTVDVIFEGRRFGGITDESKQVIEDHAGRNPRNALYACMSARWGSGSYPRAQALLLDPAIFPDDRLPTSADYCERWITQREDDDKGWQPCPLEQKVHPAGAFLLAAAVCQGEI